MKQINPKAKKNEQIIHAGMKDLLRPKQETMFWEYQLILTRIDHLLINLDSWTSNRSGQIRGRTMTWPSTQRIRPEPLGVAKKIRLHRQLNN